MRATWPEMESVNPAEFPNEERERINDFFGSGLSREPEHDIINSSENTRRRLADDGREIVDQATYHKLTKSFLNDGGIIIRGEDAESHLGANNHAAYVPGAKVAFIRDDATVSDVLEEMMHAKQDRRGDYNELSSDEILLRREIDAQHYLLSVIDKYKIPESETLETRNNLNYYEEKLKQLLERRQGHG